MRDRWNDLNKSVQRDARRLERKERGHGSFWRSLGVLGAIGWPIVLLAAGGGWLGGWIDARWHTGPSLTVGLVVIGALAGCLVAWQVVRGTQ